MGEVTREGYEPKNVLVLLELSEAQRARLEAGAPGAEFVYAEPAEAGSSVAAPCDPTDEQVAAADVVVGNLAPARVPLAANLQLMQLNSAGYDGYAAANNLPAGARLCCAVGAYGQAVSEHVFAQLLGLMKHLPGYHDLQRAHEWADLGPVTSLRGANVLVLGAGDIGSHFAQLCAGMGAHVTGVNRHGGEAPAGFERVVTMAQMREHLGEADVVVSFLPSTPETQGLANAGFFAAMRCGAYFANGGRGDLVVNEDLVAALACGQLAGAALDVMVPEPLSAESPLWDAPNLALTPHVSGGFHLAVVLDNIVDIAAENLRRLRAGEPLRNHVLG
jgi:phosphoglycerate dehydrogenase-like enzyme